MGYAMRECATRGQPYLDEAASNIGKSRQVASDFLDAQNSGCWNKLAAGDGYRDLCGNARQRPHGFEQLRCRGNAVQENDAIRETR